MVIKVTREKDKKSTDWTDVKVKVNGKVLNFSVNEDGTVLIMCHSSTLELTFTEPIYYNAVVTKENKGGIVKVNFKTLND